MQPPLPVLRGLHTMLDEGREAVDADTGFANVGRLHSEGASRDRHAASNADAYNKAADERIACGSRCSALAGC